MQWPASAVSNSSSSARKMPELMDVRLYPADVGQETKRSLSRVLLVVGKD
jgi:hypothetical protein